MLLPLINHRFNHLPFLLPVFAYGATGAGKTYTMLGSEESPGIMYLTMVELYKRIEARREEKSCEVLVSYQEVHCGRATSPPALRSPSLGFGVDLDPVVPCLGYLLCCQLCPVSSGQPESLTGSKLSYLVQ